MYRITLTSKSAFYKNDMTITSIQQSYECPPLSTVFGLISAAVGEKVESIELGYIFNYKYKVEDYELITRPISKKNKKYNLYREKYLELISNKSIIDRHDILQGLFGAVPIIREVLFDCSMYLYVKDEYIAKSFLSPYYTLLMGRSEDLAFVKEVKKVQLKEGETNIVIGKTIIPFDPSNTEVYGRICSMPVNITEDIPRKVTKSGIFMIIDRNNYKVQNKLNQFLYDEELGQGVYIHR